MSRIHEALKHAAQGRETGLIPEAPKPVVPQPVAPPIDPSTNTTEAADLLNLGSVPTVDGPVVTTTSGYLAIEDLWQRCPKSGWKLDPAYSVFSGDESADRCAEQFRKLRARLYQLRETEMVRTLLVTSTVPGEGKTFVSLNLALAIARQHNRRVLLVDADLRASKLARCLGVPASPGLTEFLRGVADEASILQTEPEGGLFFVPGGTTVANPTELLASDRLEYFLARMAPIFDWVVVDAPPILPVSDTSVLAKYCDGVVMVVRAGSTGYDAVGAALRDLREKKVLGIVLNRAEQKESYSEYTYYAEERMAGLNSI